MRAGRVRWNMKGWRREIHDCEIHDELGLSSDISSSISLTMSMNYVYNVTQALCANVSQSLSTFIKHVHV
jgi:hypothetical protein